MANPFYSAMGGSQAPQGGKRNLAPNLLQYMQNFQGNPMEILQGKINSGEISQTQYKQLHDMAENIVSRMMSVLPRN